MCNAISTLRWSYERTSQGTIPTRREERDSILREPNPEATDPRQTTSTSPDLISFSQRPTFHTQYMTARVFLPGHTKNQQSTPMLVQTAGLLCRMQARQRSGGFWKALVVTFSIHIGLQRTLRGHNGIEARRRARRSAARDGGSICWTTPGSIHTGVPHWTATPKSTVCWWE